MKHLRLRLLFSISIFAISQLYVNDNFAQCDITDWESLQALYVSTDGPNWVNAPGWDLVDPAIHSSPPPGCDLSTMFGVNLNANGRVRTLNLTGKNLSGPLPPELGDLAELTSLQLAGDPITGTIPSQISNLTNLVSLSLFDNQLTGTIPPQIWTMTSLGVISFRDNMLTGSIPSAIGNLTNLNSFNVSRNMMSGNLPVELWTLVNLTQLTLSNNQFTGTIPSDIGNLVNLNNLFLSSNQFSGPIPSEIGELDLSNLLISSNQFVGSIPSSFGNLTNLNQFNVSNNLLTGCYDEALIPLCTWSNLNVSNNNNFDAAWEDFCLNGDGACIPPGCTPNAHVEVQSADVYIDDACHGVILTSPGGMCYRLRVQDDGSFISELVSCP